MQRTEEFFTIKEVATILKITEDTVYSWLQDGRLKGIQLGGWSWRIKREDFNEFVKSTEEKPNGS